MKIGFHDIDCHRASRLSIKLKDASYSVWRILNRALLKKEISQADGQKLFEVTTQADREAIYATADTLRAHANSEYVTFVVNRNINFTNVCYMGCRFCSFAKRKEDAAAEWLTSEQVVSRAHEAWDRGGSEVCLQGGLHPKIKGSYYREIVLAIKKALPDMHIHAFSPFEIWYGAKKSKLSYRDFLCDLRDCGLGSMPGTAAEILDTKVRQELTKNKLSTDQWVEIIRTAHEVGLRTTATIMYGHVDKPEHWAAHIALIRDIQRDMGGFTEFVPLNFVHTDSPLYTQNPDTVRSGPTVHEVDLMHAVSRIMLAGFIDNIQVSWTKLGAERAQQILHRGVNDLGGTLMNESISRAAGSKHGQEITSKEFCDLIRAAGRVPVRRNTIYKTIDVYKDHDPAEHKPLVNRHASDPLAFLKMFPEVAI
ncbi:MAG: 5-amino-6-(D-ribitylamino)uracil--L-tyrosine 4-hydroxyphenyl transferase CofH [Aestuariivita sp.]|nr:5-amino-6-(D-ribitylamino)uracil--L-tyrosine 4-hydroxyphenyl transferase CofH [Aestuariivita sp.]